MYKSEKYTFTVFFLLFCGFGFGLRVRIRIQPQAFCDQSPSKYLQLNKISTKDF